MGPAVQVATRVVTAAAAVAVSALQSVTERGPITASEKEGKTIPQSAGGVRCHLLAGLIDPGRTAAATSHE